MCFEWILSSWLILLLVVLQVHCSCVLQLCICTSDKVQCDSDEQNSRQLGSELPEWNKDGDVSVDVTTLNISTQDELKVMQQDGLLIFKRLKSLHLIDCTNLDTFDRHWMHGVNKTLEILNITNAPKLTSLPMRVFTNETQMRILSITGTSLTQVDFLHGTEANRFEELHLADNHLVTIIPGSFSGLDHLKHVDLQHNKFISLDKCIFYRLSRLNRLFLRGNNWQCNCRMAWVKSLAGTGYTAQTGDHPTHKWAPENRPEAVCSTPSSKINEELTTVSITECREGDSNINAFDRDCEDYDRIAAGYLTTVPPVTKDIAKLNITVVYILVACGLLLMLMTVIVCMVTYFQLKGEMLAEQEKGTWWQDESGQGVVFGKGGGGGGGGDDDDEPVSKSRNPFRRFLIPFVRRNFANAPPATTMSKKPTKAKEYNARRKQGKLQGMKRKEMSIVHKTLSTLKSTPRPV